MPPHLCPFAGQPFPHFFAVTQLHFIFSIAQNPINFNTNPILYTNADGSVSIAAINWKTEQTEVRIESEHPISKPLRKYVFEAAHIPYNDFCDLQDFSELVRAADNQITTVLPPRSITFLTADYTDRVPSEITGLQISDGKLFWNACEDEEHCYYRVYENGKQIASTVAQSIETNGIQSKYEVLSVDKWGNVRKR